MNHQQRGIRYESARFLQSAEKLQQCPDLGGAEVAFAGRSNAGKSSAINALTNNGKLARTSKTPGRTQLINFFSLSDQFRLVDLPGYGYAKVPLATKERWQKNLQTYLERRDCLQGLVIVMDIRHPLKEYDTAMLQWGLTSQLPVHLLLTKADKLKFGAQKKALQDVRKQVKEYGGEISIQLFSASKKSGIDELKARLDSWLLEPELDEATDTEA